MFKRIEQYIIEGNKAKLNLISDKLIQILANYVEKLTDPIIEFRNWLNIKNRNILSRDFSLFFSEIHEKDYDSDFKNEWWKERYANLNNKISEKDFLNNTDLSNVDDNSKNENKELNIEEFIGTVNSALADSVSVALSNIENLAKDASKKTSSSKKKASKNS